VEADSLNQRYTQTIWSRESLGKRIGGYEYNLLEVKPIQDNKEQLYGLPEEILNRLNRGKAAKINAGMLANSKDFQGSVGNPDRSVLLVPLLMYNQIVGIIGLEDDQTDHEWSEDEIAVVGCWRIDRFEFG
jgi:GAF domain-containing protein